MNHRSRAVHKRVGRRFAMALAYLVIAFSMAFGWLYQSIPDTIYVEQGKAVRFARFPFLAPQGDTGTTRTVSTAQTGSFNTTLAIGGMVPVKQVRTIVTERPVVTVCGTPFGIKMFSDGALVVGFSDILTDGGWANPAKDAGLRLGDLVISVNGFSTQSNDEVRQIIEQANGNTVQVIYLRDGVQRSTRLTPVRGEDGSWKAGMWVRDSSAGVGTMTFF
ncbi:MAG: PDZ domain-containing protein, partial [Faecalibacterium sp.]|nr:PDZ domain-containing protein [Faecalibacterium sp.]